MMKLYISPCPNDTFMFDAMIHNRVDCEGLDLEVEYLDIEELNTRALRGEAEFSKVSCALLPSIKERYEMCSSGAAMGRGNGPLLVRRRGETTPLRRIAIPGVYTTANMLVRRLLPQIEERVPMLFSDVASAIERGEVDGGVLIHEGRFLYAQRGLELVSDLGELWERDTQLPLPLGAIVMRRDVDRVEHERFTRVLRRSIEYAFENPTVSREFVKRHAQEMDDSVIDAHISLFVNDFSLSLSREGQLAIEQIL